MKRIRPRLSGKKTLRPAFSSRRLSNFSIVPDLDAVQCDVTTLEDMRGGPEFMQVLKDLYQNHPVRFYILNTAALLEGLRVSLRLNKPLDSDTLDKIQAHLQHTELILRYCHDCPARAWPDISCDTKTQ